MKRSISIITSLLLSISTIAIILFLTVDRSSIERLREVKIQWFILAVLLHFLSWVIWGLRISVMSGHLDREKKINLRESMEITLANLFLAAITPSMAGGEPVRIHLISKKGFGIGRGTALVLGERVFDGIFVLSLVPLSLIVFSTYIHEEVIKLGLLLGLILFLVGISIFVYSVLRPDSVSRLIKSIIKKIKLKRLERNLESLFEKVDGFVDAFHKGARDIFKRENKVGILIIALLTASFWFIEFLIPSCILLGLDQ
ncbi:MAG TPA: flippase-like domain-containing protein, partial [Thermoplasmatales archaeon]|nr:flippase-like domain-containing protein [Thermoplasmatales archaeon]HEX17129.1 flippase-like domain-containing protein [Thermoplasmatales archaeon]